MPSDDLALARRGATAGGEIAADRFRDTVHVETKAHKNDLVSEADRAAQQRVQEILTAGSDVPVVGEESGGLSTIPDAGRAWIVDPIDGTANYLRGIPFWTTSVALVEDHQPTVAATVMPPASDEVVAGDQTEQNGTVVTVSDRTDVETFAVAALGWGAHGERTTYGDLARAIIARCGDVRRFGSMQASLAAVATGGLEGAITTQRPNPWDSVAGAHLIRQAGGTVTALDGSRWTHDSVGLVASNGRAHETLLEIARSVGDESA